MRNVVTSNSRKVRRAMASSIWAICILVSFHCSVTCWLSIKHPYLDDEEFDQRFGTYRQRWRLATEEGRKAVVIVGSSRLEWGLSARLAEQEMSRGLRSSPIVHNFGFAGSGPLFDWAVVHRLLESSAPPHLVVVEINPMYCGTDKGVPYETTRLSRIKLLPSERRGLVKFGWKHFHTSTLLDEFVPMWVRCRGELLSGTAIGKRPSKDDDRAPPDQWGDSNFHVPTPDASGRTILTKMAKDNYYEGLQNLEIPATVERALDDLVATCRTRGIRVLFIVMPESEEFRKWYGSKTRERIDELFCRLTCDGFASYYNASEWLPDQNLYYDTHHLLEAGSRMFSQRLAMQCLAPWVRTAPPSRRPIRPLVARSITPKSYSLTSS